MMTVARFAATIELMPLIQGEIKVVSMRLEQPQANVIIDDTGSVDWLVRAAGSKTLDPNKVSLENVTIADGAIAYTDLRTGIAMQVEHIDAAVEARSLAGPWRIDGSYLEGETRVPFQLATGRRLDDGSIRLKAEFSPAGLPLLIVADGVIGIDDDQGGLNYAGTYDLTEVVAAEEGEAGEQDGWRSAGTFALTRDALVVDKAVLTEGPPDRPASFAGSLRIDLGKTARFSAKAEARQLDLDRSLAKGPSEPMEVGKAAQQLVDWVSSLYVPPLPGQVTFDVPGIIVGGSVIQDVRFVASPKDKGWQISDFQADLPGHARLEANGTITTADKVGFFGDVRLAVNQPATFAAWWRGRREPGAGRLLAPFDLSGRATINQSEIAVDAMQMTIGDAIISGDFSWSGARQADKRRLLETDLKADRLDFVQLRALAELLVGKDLADTSVIADSYSVKLAAGELAIQDVVMRDVSVDAGFVDGTLTVNEVQVGDLGGARLSVPRGRIESMLEDKPLGSLEAHLSAPTLDGLARVVERIAPGSELALWLSSAAPSLAPAAVDLEISAPPADGSANVRTKLSGAAGTTTFEAILDLTGNPAQWQKATAKLSASARSYDALSLAKQAGLSVTDVEAAGSAEISASLSGVPEKGMAASVNGGFAGVTFGGEGTLHLAADLPVAFKGNVKVSTDDLDPLMKMAGLGIPGAAVGTSVDLSGTLETLSTTADFAWSNGNIAGLAVGGRLRVADVADGSLEVGGELTVDEADLGWIAALSLGFPPLPTGDPETPWSKAPFADPVFGPVGGKLTVASDRLVVGDQFTIAKAKFGLKLEPDRIDLDLSEGQVAGGTISGGFSIHNVDGNANVTGRISLKDAALEALVWERLGRPVATGVADISANFEATGRSPAGLISTLTGGGALAIRDAEARYVNPRAVSLVVRAADLGQPFTEETLSELFRSFIDGGSITFKEADGAFAIAGGTVRLKSLPVEAAEANAVGNAAIDLNTMTIDSDWTLTLDTGGGKEEAAPAQVGIVFQGPVAEPDRSFDVLQFWSYLNIRQEERVQEILAMEEASRLEKERFSRERRKLREDAARREREAREAMEARVRAAENVEALHVSRETREDERALAAAELAAATAASAAEEASAADTAAETAAEVAAAARTKANAASEAAAEIASAARTAAEAADTAAKEMFEAQRVAAETTAAAETATAGLDAAEARLAEARVAEETANGIVTAAATETQAADDAAKKAAKLAKEATDAAAKARIQATQAEAVAAERTADAKAAADKVEQAAAAAAAAKAAAERAVAEKAAGEKVATESAAAAKLDEDVAAVQAGAAEEAAAALEGAERARAERNDARETAEAAVVSAATALEEADAALSAARRDVTDAEKVAAQRASLETTALNVQPDVQTEGELTALRQSVVVKRAAVAKAETAAADADAALKAAKGEVATAIAAVASAESLVNEKATAHTAAAEKAATAQATAKAAAEAAIDAKARLADLATAEAQALIEAANARADEAEARTLAEKTAAARNAAVDAAAAKVSEAAGAEERASAAKLAADGAAKTAAEKAAAESTAVETAALAAKDRVAAEEALAAAKETRAKAVAAAGAATKAVGQKTTADEKAKIVAAAAAAEQSAADAEAAQLASLATEAEATAATAQAAASAAAAKARRLIPGRASVLTPADAATATEASVGTTPLVDGQDNSALLPAGSTLAPAAVPTPPRKPPPPAKTTAKQPAPPAKTTAKQSAPPAKTTAKQPVKAKPRRTAPPGPLVIMPPAIR